MTGVRPDFRGLCCPKSSLFGLLFPPNSEVILLARGCGGVKSTGVSQSVGETSRDESQNVLSTQQKCPKTFSPPKKSSKQEIWSSQFFRDLSQVVRRTLRDTPVPLYTRYFPVGNSHNANFHSRNGISRLEHYKSHNSRSNSRGDSPQIDGYPLERF